jgi:hypothetical protein
MTTETRNCYDCNKEFEVQIIKTKKDYDATSKQGKFKNYRWYCNSCARDVIIIKKKRLKLPKLKKIKTFKIKKIRIPKPRILMNHPTLRCLNPDCSYTWKQKNPKKFPVSCVKCNCKKIHAEEEKEVN